MTSNAMLTIRNVHSFDRTFESALTVSTFPCESLYLNLYQGAFMPAWCERRTSQVIDTNFLKSHEGISQNGTEEYVSKYHSCHHGGKFENKAVNGQILSALEMEPKWATLISVFQCYSSLSGKAALKIYHLFRNRVFNGKLASVAYLLQNANLKTWPSWPHFT